MRDGYPQLRIHKQEHQITLVSMISHFVRSRTDCPRTDNYIMLKLGERRVVQISSTLANVIAANDLTAYGYTVNADGSIIKPST